MIPKKIHYCWFGGKELPKLAKKCIASWKKFCPDYEIIEWNESNFDINCCDYVREAYDAKKWAFVSDYARFEILYKYGGIYFDTDVEVVKPFSYIVERGPFMGCEREDKPSVAPGLGLGALPGMLFLKEILENYRAIHFLNEDGSQNLKTIVDYTTEIMLKYGLKCKNKPQYIMDMYVYPKEYFCPIDLENGLLNKTNNTYTIHWYSASWEKKTNIIRGKVYRFISRYFGKRTAQAAKNFFGRK